MPTMHPPAVPFLALAALLILGCGAACAGPPGSAGNTPGTGADLEELVWSDELADGSGVTALAAGPDGSVYAAGWTTLPLSEGGGQGGRDAFVRRYSADGQVAWTRQFGALGDDNAEDLAVDRRGNVYVAARVDGPVGANPSGGGRDGFVAAYGPDGAELWSLQIGTDHVDWADAVAVAEDGQVFVSGSTSGAFPGQHNRGSSDNFLARIDPGGELAAVLQFGSEEGMGATALSVSAGRVYMAGSTLGPLSADPVGDEHAGSSDLYLKVFDLAGSDLWTWTFGSNHADSTLDLTVDPGGAVVLVGTTRAVLPNPVIGIGNRVGGFLDAFAIGLSADGQIAWVRQFGTEDWDVASTVSPGRDGALYVAGRTKGSFPGQAARGGYDVFVSAMDSQGQVRWSRQMGSPVDDVAYAVAVGPGDGLFLGGSGGLVGGGPTEVERGWIIHMTAPSE